MPGILNPFAFFLIAGLYKGKIEFNINELQFIQSEGLIKLRLPNFELTDEPGAPELPCKALKIALPLNARIRDIRIASTEKREFELSSNISYAQAPVILSQGSLEKRVVPKPAIYQSSKPYPDEILRVAGYGVYKNFQICELICIPFQYYPLLKKLVAFKSIRFEIYYDGKPKETKENGILKKIVSNGSDLLPDEQILEQKGLQYVIITEEPMDTVFKRLADWKNKKGIPAGVRSVNWILNHYPGEDNPAKIRNYLKTLSDSNTRYVLLGGDVNIIPCRFAYAMTCSAGIVPGREDTMPCDLYYGDLQGNWDFDNDQSYGEIEDSVDLYPDLFVGRAPVKTIAEAQRFVEKVLRYEKNPELNYLDNALFAAEILWADPYTDESIHKNRIGNESFPPYYQLTKLYQSLGNETKEAVMQAIRQGQNLINHDGHGWINLISVGGWPHRIYSIDFDTMTNSPRYGILYSIGCWTNAFDSACVGEAFVNSPNGGGVAYIGNSSYGWGSPGNPGFGYSDRFDFRFFYSLFREDNFHLGEALALAKAYFIPYSREENVYRWHQYQVNLLGDPELPVWTKIPDTLLVSYPQFIPLGSARVLITVQDKVTNLPIKDALVCLMKGNESYSAGYTDATGSIFLDARTTDSGYYDLTISAHNYIPLEITIPVVNGPYVNYCGWQINDIFGNNDQIPNPGENILLPTKILNSGSSTARDIQLGLSTNDTIVVILDSIALMDSLLSNDSITINDAFAIRIKDSAVNGNFIRFNLSSTFNNQTLLFNPCMIIGTPVIHNAQLNITTPPVLPGQVESLFIELKNTGYGAGHSVYGILSSIDPYLFILVDTLQYGEIPPGTSKIDSLPFVLYISPFCPVPHQAHLLLKIYSENYQFTDTVLILVGETGFYDDMESQTNYWTTGGLNNLWHISERRSFSLNHSWYCGNETTAQYIDNMNCYIQSIPFMIQKNSLFKFYRWFNVPIYGRDGIYVIVIHNGNEDTLDFIGTGGALKKREIQSDWFCEKYRLKDYSAGDTIQIRFVFISDNDGHTGEGFYIDDVCVEYLYSISEADSQNTPSPRQFFYIHPNPFRKNLLIRFKIPEKGIASIKIFDISGRLVKEWGYEILRLSDQILWNGTDDSGRRLPSGVYFVRLESDIFKSTEKAILLR